jgi:transcriptional regulator MraZ
MQGSGGPSRGVKFIGSYTHQIDEKGRVSLPAPFRREAADQRFVLVQPYPPALALYPEIEWGEVQERLEDMMARGPAERMHVLGLLSNAVEVQPDTQGRILIPARQKEAAGLTGPVKIVGAINKIELWEPDLFDQAQTTQSAAFEKFRAQLFR